MRINKPPFASGCLVIGLLLITSFAYSVNLYTYTSAGTTGNWNSAGTWTTDPTGATLVGSAVPGNNDVVTILNGFTVTLTADVTTTGLTIIINNGGVLDLANRTFGTISSLSGSGTLRIRSAYFPTVTTNDFVNSAASGATVNYYNFTGGIPTNVNYPNLLFSNSAGANQVIAFANPASSTVSVFGNLTTSATGGQLFVRLGNQATNIVTLDVYGNVTVGANSTLGAGLFNAIHTMNVEGNMTNNGTVLFSNSAQYATSSNGAVRLNFRGATDRTLSCQGPTNLYTLHLDKGEGSANILSVISSDVANFKLYSSEKLIQLTNGTLRLGANISIDRMFGSGSANYDVGFTDISPMFWVDGATVNTNGSALVVYGKFRITSGSFTTLGGQGCVIRDEGQYLIEGGTFTTEKFRPSSTNVFHRGTFIMSGGVFNAIGTTGSDGNYARFSIPYPEQVFIMSGGTLNIRNSNGATGSLHIGSNPSNQNVTGGTINIVLSGTSTNFNMISTAELWNLTVSRVAGATPTQLQLANIGSLANAQNTAQPLVVKNNLVIEGANAGRLTANNLNVTVGGNFIIENGATYSPGNNVTTLNGTGDQNFDISGTITSGLNDMTVSKNSGTVNVIGGSPGFDVRGTLSLYNGILNDGGKIIRALGNVHNDAVHTGTGYIRLNASSTQTISGDGTGIFGNLRLDNTSTPGANLTSDVTISGALTLAGTGNSIFHIGPYQLGLTSPSATALTTTENGFSSAKMIRTLGLQSDRGVKKTYGNLTAFTYHFGSGTEYTPATIQLTSAPTTYGTVSVKPVNTRHPFVAVGNTQNLTYYWKVQTEGFSGIAAGSVSHQYKYLPSKVSPVNDDVNYVPARYGTGGWTVINNLTQVDEASDLVYFTGVDYLDGDFTAGVPTAFGTVEVYYSMRSGTWEDANPATTPWSLVGHTGPAASSAPGPNDQVFIGDGVLVHNITVTTNGRSTGSISIAQSSTLDVGTTTGHNFGRLEITSAGAGILRISSATATAEFPAGDFGLFIRQTGGTVEYYTTGATNFTIPQNSASPTLLPLITYRHFMLTPGAGATITMPNQDLTILGNMRVQGTAVNGVANLNAAAARNLVLEANLFVASGTFQFQNGTPQNVSILGTVNISAGAIWDVSALGTATSHVLTLTGNIVNNGTLDFSKTGGRVCNTTFTGTANTSITGTGPVTDFNILRVNKGTNQSSVLNVNATAFSLSGGTLPLELTNGTFRLTSAQAVTIANGAIFNIPATTRLSANGGTMQLTGGNGIDMRLAGTLEILSGTVDVGTTSNDNSIEYAATGTPTLNISGGTLNVNAQIRRSTASTQGAFIYNQSGGTVTVGLVSTGATRRGVFEILNTGSSYTMSGGLLRVVRVINGNAIAELFLQPAAFNVTGGTIEGGTTVASSQIIDINTTIPLHNLTVDGSANASRLNTNSLVLRGTLHVKNDNYFTANGLSVSIAGNLINENPTSANGFNAGGYRSGTATQVTTFNGATSHQSITGAVGNRTVFTNLVINNSFAGGVVSLGSNTTLRITAGLTLTRGTFHDGGNQIVVLGNVSNSATHTSSGSGHIRLAGVAGQSVGGNGTGRFGNLTIGNTDGVTLTANQQVTGILNLDTGPLFINQFNLYVSNTSLTAITGFNETKYIVTSGQLSNGGLRKAFNASVTNGSFTYPVGVAGKYTPAVYTITTGVIGGSITVKPVNSKHPGATGSGGSYLNYYWSVTNDVIIINALTHRYQYVDTDRMGTPADYRDAFFNAGAWTIGVTPGNPNLTTRLITFTNTNVAGDYTAGEPTAFVNPTTYISITSGDWESDNDIWDQDPPGNDLGPPAGSFVIIAEGHTITINTNTKRPATLDVRGRLQLGTSTGHDFGAVSATGVGERTIQIQSSIFPSGDFSNFMAANAGTIEYNGNLTLPTQPLYNNLLFTGAGTKIMPNADLTLNGSFTIQQGTVNNSVSDRSIVLISTDDDFTNQGSFNAGSGAVIIGRHLINTGGTFTAPGGGILGLEVGGNITNSAGASFVGAADPIVVAGSVTNSATFTAGTGGLDVEGDVSTSGTFTTGTGIINVGGTLTNSNVFSAGTGAINVDANVINSGTYTANSNVLTILGGFQNNAGTFNANTGSITLSGNWSNTGTFNSGTGRVSFMSAGAQALTGATTFYDVTRSNGGTLTLNSSITVSNSLTLAGGKIATGVNTVALTNSTVQPVTGFTTTSFIDGRISISYPNAAGTSRIYPVGRGTIYRPVTIYQNAASTDPVVRVEMINTPPTGSYPSTIQVLSEARYYSVDLLSGTMVDPVVELSFNTNAPVDENVAIAGNARIVRATAPTGPWTDEGGSGVFSPAAPAGYATSETTSIANPTFFALGYQNAPLPITLGHFDAKLANDVVLLNWTTFSETNNAFFTIQRSESGLVYDSVLSVPGAGNSRETLRYSAIDMSPLSGVSYYRLKQTDYDGKVAYSDVVRVENNQRRAASISIYPNPTTQTDDVFVKMVNHADHRGYIVISSVAGKVFFEGTVDLSVPFNLGVATGHSLMRGVYIVKITSSDLQETGKLVVK